METALHAVRNYLYICIIIYSTIKLCITRKKQKCYTKPDVLIKIFSFCRPPELLHNNIVSQKKSYCNYNSPYSYIIFRYFDENFGPFMGPYFHDFTNYRLNQIYFDHFQ